jgi:hypothetical protein
VQDDVSILLIVAESASTWPESSWDDLLIVVFNSNDFPKAGNRFIADCLEKRPDTSLLLPVALNAASGTPPEAAGCRYVVSAESIQGALSCTSLVKRLSKEQSVCDFD